MSKKKKFQWMHRVLPNGKKENALFIDNEQFEWSVDEASVAKVAATGDEFMMNAIKKDIEQHFLDSLSEFVGRKITFKEVKEAEKTGWI
tara:strand:+ start:67 stop:333 length:267 start_codon:yes stop_codon:yes gene_type:complete